MVVVLVTLLLLAELREATIATMINSNATPPTTQTVGLFIQAGASAAVDVVVCVSVVFVWEASVASWANAYTPDIRQRNNRKHFEAALIIVFFIKLVCVSCYIVKMMPLDAIHTYSAIEMMPTAGTIFTKYHQLKYH